MGSEMPGGIVVRIRPDHQRIVIKAEQDVKVVSVQDLGETARDVEIQLPERRGPSLGKRAYSSGASYRMTRARPSRVLPAATTAVSDM